MNPSLAVVAANAVLTAIVVAAWHVALHRAYGRRALAPTLALLAWIAGTWILARSGVLGEPSSGPPRMSFLLVPAGLATIVLMLSPVGARLLAAVPLEWIIGFQLFRLPVELVLWRLAHEGLVPERMTFDGANHDVVTAVLAPVAALAWRRTPPGRLTVLLWNVGGLALLVNVVSIAVRSFPSAWNAWPDEPPLTSIPTSSFLWIASVHVVTALAAHVLVFRALLMPPRARDQSAARARDRSGA